MFGLSSSTSRDIIIHGMRIALVVNDLQVAGGVIVILQHAQGLLRLGHDVVIIRCRTDVPTASLPAPEGVALRELSDVSDMYQFDVAVSTWWETNYSLWRVPSKSYVWFCQSMEDRFYTGAPQQSWEARSVSVTGLPVITEASWIVRQLRSWTPSTRVELVKNGLDHKLFTSTGRTDATGPLRVLVEGGISSPFKGVGETLFALSLCSEPIAVTHVSAEKPDSASLDGICRIGPLSMEEMAYAYRASDVLVKLSRVEGMFGPPLEAFACGATSVVTPVTGHEEYIQHGVNALVVPWDDPQAVARTVDRLARDRGLLRRLQLAGERTAEHWPSWEESTSAFERALTMLIESDARDGHPSQTIVRGLKALGWVAAATRGPVTGGLVGPQNPAQPEAIKRQRWE